MRRAVGLAVVLLALAGCEVNPAERNNAGNSLYQQGNDRAAIHAYQLAQVNGPDSPQAYYNAASALSRSGQMQDAINALQQALKTADDELAAQAYYNLGNVYFEMALYADAVAAYRETLLRRPDDEQARYNYELALSRLLTMTPSPEPEQEDPTPEPTPTGDTGGEQETPPTPTPDAEGTDEAEGDIENDDSDDPVTVTPDADGQLTLEDVERQLDAVQENQRNPQLQLERGDHGCMGRAERGKRSARDALSIRASGLLCQ